MKALVTAALLAFLCVGSRAQQLTPPELTPPTPKPPPPLTPPLLTPTSSAPASPFPSHLKPAFDVLTAIYPKLDSKKLARSPADSAWLLRSSLGGTGTVEVGFQGADIVYMVFRRGVGGAPWTEDDVTQLHRSYSMALLKERRVGELFNRAPSTSAPTHDLARLRYGDGRVGNRAGVSNSAAYIYRQDFNVSTLMGGL